MQILSITLIMPGNKFKEVCPMSLSPCLGTIITNTKMRTPESISSFSGMCSKCTADCIGDCEIGYSAIRGEEALYPVETANSQFASEKTYPIDFSHFNINGRVFGALDIKEDSDRVSYPNVKLDIEVGRIYPINLKAPFILPAMATLNWQDYFAGAAITGLLAVIGEDVILKDTELEIKNNKVLRSPLLEKMVSSFKQYYHGFGEIILQANVDDDNLGVLDYAIKNLGVTAVEIKFGQGAKGIQGMSTINNLKDALGLHYKGYLVYPNPSDPGVQEKYQKGIGPHFMKIGRLPMWNEEALIKRIDDLHKVGAKHITFKMASYDPNDIIRVLKIATYAKVDLVTFDAAGGGTGNSPCKMMNEWGLPIVYMESILYEILQQMEKKNFILPKVAVGGGFAMEDQIFKGLSLGAPYISMIAIGRAAMAAAMTGKKVGDLIIKGDIPKKLQKYGSTVEDIYRDIRRLKEIYGSDVNSISLGAIGVYSYINRVMTGLKQLMTLNRKFNLNEINRNDIIALTKEAGELSGISTAMDFKNRVKDIL